MKSKMIYTLLILIAVLLTWQVRLFWIAAGRQPRGERLARCEKSPVWKDGAFCNYHATPQLTSDDGVVTALWKYLFKNIPNLSPSTDVPTAKHDLHAIPRSQDVCVWLGHSSIYLQLGGVRYLFDPVLTNRLPVWLFMRPFKGADVYHPEDIPDVDYLIITHDHWDHLDWRTVRALRDRVTHVVCALGIGEHFQYWGYDEKKISDLDWNDSIVINDTTTLRCLPTRHFSGRLLGRGKTLWASYLIDGPRRVFVSGDGGYDERFERYGKQFPNIDLAIMENGQYDAGWRYIHTMPDELPRAIHELGARRVLTYHHSKYALANHAWTEPLEHIYTHASDTTWQLLTPRIGDPVMLDQQQTFAKWW